jgi:DNA-binding MarR family transcriptional regulator
VRNSAVPAIALLGVLRSAMMKLMSKQQEEASTYLKFLNLVQAIRERPSFAAIDPVEERLLNLFAAVWHTAKRCTVVEAMGMVRDVSPSTVHRRLNSLREKGLIALETDAKDSRIKYVVATDKTTQYFAQLAKCMSHAAGA